MGTIIKRGFYTTFWLNKPHHCKKVFCMLRHFQTTSSNKTHPAVGAIYFGNLTENIQVDPERLNT